MNSKIVGIHSNDEVVPSPIDGEHAYVSYETLSADLDEIKNILDEAEDMMNDAAVSAPSIGTKDANKYFPQIFGIRRTGAMFVRKCPGTKVLASVEHGFTVQDQVKNTYRDEEIKGHDARFAILLEDGESKIVFGKMFSDWFMTNSLIAQMSRNGWFVMVV